ncbi:MAG: hypothetical protein H6718_31570 [Polyangiaceae bacterium]|nr:hypothetical protein [Polyangiaceae bacterium]
MPYSRHDLDDGFALSSRGGDCQLFHLAPGLVKVSYRGLATRDFAEHVTRELEILLRHDERLEVFVDAGALRSYHSDFRKEWTSWLSEHKSSLDGLHIHFQSRIVEMGINLVNVVIGDFIRPYPKREEFERQLERTLALKRTA